MAKQFLPVLLETNLFSRIIAGQIKQLALEVRTGRGLSSLTVKVEGRPLNALLLQLTPSSQ